jgi:hypothetical protein
MLNIDRDMYLAFAESLGTDFRWLSEVVDGRRQAGPALAAALALKTKTKERLWTAEGKGLERLVAVRVWYAVWSRLPDFKIQQPAPVATRRGCDCDD